MVNFNGRGLGRTGAPPAGAAVRRVFLCSAAAAAIALAMPHGALAGSAALPTGGVVQSGQATIAASGASALTISQSSKAAIINWSSFSIGQGGSVQFNNGSGATLNRVLSGGPISSLDGLLSATGSVYLINPSGVIIGKTGVVKVGGTFAASTLDVDNAAFLNGGSLTFSGTSKASVVNLGKVEALGGDVVLAAAVVENAGSIQAPNGDVGLLAGYNITIKDLADQNGLFTVQIGGTGTSVTNEGLISAAAAELRANGGNVYALAGNTGSVFKATEVSSQGGQIFLTAPGGTVSVASGVTLDASGTGSGSGGHILVDSANTSFHGTALAKGGPLGGDGGLVETSGGTLDFAGAKVSTTAAHGRTGTWLLDPWDLTIDAAGASTIESGLASNNVVVQTTSPTPDSTYGTANSSGSGDITVAAPITWSSSNTLTLDAYHSLHVNAPITVAGGGGVVITTNDGGTGGDYDFGLTSTGFSGSISYTAGPGSGASLTINGTPYTLLYSMSDVQDINASDTALQGNYALAASLDASSVTSWTPIGTDGAGTVLNAFNGFRGAFTGLGHTIANLTVNLPFYYVGLFGLSGGTIRDIGLVGGTGSVTGGYHVGGLVGQNDGAITDAYATGAVSGGGYVGGLVGGNNGTISNAYATGNVSASTSGGGYVNYVGGLVGDNYGAISGAYATGAVSAANASASNGSEYVGGLIGFNNAAISSAYATGNVTVSGGYAAYVGGLIGYNYGTITNAHATGAVGASASNGYVEYVGGLIGQNNGAISGGYATGVVSASGSSAYKIAGLVGQNYGAITNAYATGAVSASSTGGGGYVGEVGGLVGYNNAAISSANATGAVSVSGSSAYEIGGLVGNNTSNGTISSAYATGAVSVSASGGYVTYVGGLVGENYGAISSAYATGAVSASASASTGYVNYVGGLVGENYGAIIDADATGAVSAASASNGSEYVGGLIGYNNAAISNAYATGNVTASGGYAEYVGGLIGYNYAAISSVYATGAVSASGSSAYAIGGLVGQNYAAITNAYATGAVSASSTSGGYVGEVGGLVGSNNAAISSANATGAVSVSGGYGGSVGGLVGYNTANGAISSAYATGAVSVSASGGYVESVGGLVGYNDAAITNAYATGAVSASASNSHVKYVGGLVGNNDSHGPISSAYATGAVSVSASGGDARYVGGLVGENYGAITNAYATGAVAATSGGYVGSVGGLVGENEGAIANAYATGAVSASGGVVGGVGGLVGYHNSGTVTNGYYDTQTTGQTTDAAGAAGLTTRQLQGLDPISGSTYFSLAANLGDTAGTIWGGGANGLYPYLASFFPNGVQAVSGVAYQNAGTTVAASGANGAVTVGLDAGGSQIGQATAGANGYYYIIVPTGTVASGQGLVAYTTANGATGAANAASYVESAMGSSGVAASGLNLYGGWQVLQGGAADTTLSGLNGLYAAAVGADAPSSFSLANLEIATAAPSFTLDAPISLSGTLALSSAGTVGQSAALSVGALQLSGGGAFTLTSASNQIGTLATITGNLSLADAGSLTIGSVSGADGTSLAGVASTGTVSISTTGSLTLASGVSAGAGYDVTLAATGAFINQAGGSAVSVSGGGRWLIYSSAPGADVFGGIDSTHTAVWNTAAGAPVTQSGNRYVFAYQPTLTVTTTSDHKTYGTDATSQIQAAYTVSGYQAGVAGAFLADTASTAYSGASSLGSAGAGTSANVAGGPYTISASLGTLTSASGYAFQFANTGQLTVNPASITVTALSGSSTSGASPANPGLSAVGLQNGQTVAVLTGLSNSFGVTPTTNAGTYTLNVAGALTNLNYIVTALNPGAWTVNQAPPRPSTFLPANGTNTNLLNSPTGNVGVGFGLLSGAGSDPNGSTPSFDQGQGSPVNTPYPDNLSGWGDIRFGSGSTQ